jgi:hypothetical protein
MVRGVRGVCGPRDVGVDGADDDVEQSDDDGDVGGDIKFNIGIVTIPCWCARCLECAVKRVGSEEGPEIFGCHESITVRQSCGGIVTLMC